MQRQNKVNVCMQCNQPWHEFKSNDPGHPCERVESYAHLHIGRSCEHPFSRKYLLIIISFFTYILSKNKIVIKSTIWTDFELGPWHFYITNNCALVQHVNSLFTRYSKLFAPDFSLTSPWLKIHYEVFCTII